MEGITRFWSGCHPDLGVIEGIPGLIKQRIMLFCIQRRQVGAWVRELSRTADGS